MFFFETRPDWFTLVPVDETGFDGLTIVNEIAGFGKLKVFGGATLSGNFVAVDIINKSR